MRGLDALAGLPPCHTSNLEAGKRPHVSAETIRKVARVFDVSMDWIYCGEGVDPAPENVIRAVATARARLTRKRRAAA